MNFRIGDRVKFLNDVGGGTVKGFLENKYVSIETDDGFEMPVLPSELMKDESTEYDNKREKQTVTERTVTQRKKIIPKVNLGEERYKTFAGGAVMAIVPENDQLLHVSDFKLYLINKSSYALQYIVYKVEGQDKTLIKSGVLEAETKLVVTKLSQSGISKISGFGVQGTFFKSGLFELVDPLNKEYIIEGISFYKGQSFEKSKYFNQKALILDDPDQRMQEAVKELTKSDVYKVVENKERLEYKKAVKKKETSGIEEVDLHIEEIVDDHSSLSNGEIITLQLDRFETSLETAIKSKTSRVVFIHGVGNGRLKHELRKKLERKYPDLKYQDASFKEYGYGATMVYLK